MYNFAMFHRPFKYCIAVEWYQYSIQFPWLNARLLTENETGEPDREGRPAVQPVGVRQRRHGDIVADDNAVDNDAGAASMNFPEANVALFQVADVNII